LTEDNRQIAGRYELTGRIGGGAMGVVWRATDRYLHRVVAIKEVLLQDGLDESKAEEAKSRAMREGRIAARLQHPNAITVFAVVEDGGRPWLVMEYLPSKSLATMLRESGRLPVAEVIEIGCQLASALSAAHEAGIVHRDIKPGNVLIGDDGTVKISDFGVSRAVGDVTITATREITGTPGFFAPEVARGEDAGFAADVFSLGATLYNAVEGVPPFGDSDNAIALLHRVSTGTTIPPTLAGPLTPMLLRLLEASPEDRPTMAEALDAFNALAVASREEVAPELPPPPVEPSPPAPMAPTAVVPVAGEPGRNKRRVRAALGLVAIALLAAAAALVIRGTGGGQDNAGQAPRTTPVTAPSQAPAAAPSPAPSQAPSTSQAPQPSSTPSQAPSTPQPSPTAAPQAPTAAISDYYALLPGSLPAGYAKLTDQFKQSRNLTLANYEGFWHQYQSVTVSGVTQQGPDRVSADVTYVTTGGNTIVEHDTFTLVQQNGQWLIDSQTVG
jgi:serine/threonine protein kinase